jgi:phenylacetic acid degradation operon negative regulatory protein
MILSRFPAVIEQSPYFSRLTKTYRRDIMHSTYDRAQIDSFKIRNTRKNLADLGIPVNPNAVVFALFAQYVLPRGGVVWLGSLIRAMATLGIGEAAARSAVLRLRKSGALEGQRMGRRTFYWLTKTGMRRLNIGGFRFSLPSEEAWDGRWTIILYSIPEEQRNLRDALRNSLKWWGFGNLAPGSWISARVLLPEAENDLRELGVWEYVSVFRSEYLGPREPSAIIAKAFPELVTLEACYRAYTAQAQAVLQDLDAGLLDNEACFATRMRNLWEIYAIAKDDPILPPALLPEDWPRFEALELSAQVRHVLSAPAELFFDTIFVTSEQTEYPE